MKVRVRQESGGWFVTEVKHWYWPFWQFAGYSLSKERAISRAQTLKNPEIIEIK